MDPDTDTTTRQARRSGGAAGSPRRRSAAGGGSGPHHQRSASSKRPTPVRPKAAGDRVRAMGSLLAILGLLFGVPLALAVFVGWPLPTEIPAWDRIQDAFERQGVPVEVIVNGLAIVVWLAWAQMAWALGVETVAVNPWYAVQFFVHNGWPGFLILGAVVLVITGAEALYADIGHFGPRPIRTAWFAVALPALLLNYFGQGALLLRDATAAQNPFYLLVPAALRVPMLFLATAAAVVASQALISGAFSLSQQAMQLGYSPRVSISHTSAHRAGQIYVREINTLLMLGCVALVLAFGTASGLAAAYGIAVTGTMAITSVLFSVVARQRFGWSAAKAGVFLVVFLTIDLAFFSANIAKVRSGGWVSLAIGLALYTLMTTWKRGREALYTLLQQGGMPLDLFLADVERRKPYRVPGTAVFLTSSPQGAPVVLLHHMKHNKVLHEQVLLLSINGADVPYVPPANRARVEALGQKFYRIEASYGFMEQPNVPEIMKCCEAAGIRTRALETTYYLGRERIIATGKAPLARWRKKLFAFMSRNARSATEFFGIPPNRVVELGAQIEF